MLTKLFILEFSIMGCIGKFDWLSSSNFPWMQPLFMKKMQYASKYVFAILN